LFIWQEQDTNGITKVDMLWDHGIKKDLFLIEDGLELSEESEELDSGEYYIDGVLHTE